MEGADVSPAYQDRLGGHGRGGRGLSWSGWWRHDLSRGETGDRSQEQGENGTRVLGALGLALRHRSGGLGQRGGVMCVP